MKQPSSAPDQKPSYARIFLTFLIGGFAITVAVFSLILIADIVQVDFLKSNTNRTRQHALLLAALSPLYGVAGAILLKLLPLLVGAVVATIACFPAYRFGLCS
jgi:hypothetical protein